MKRIVFATNNPNKLAEARQLLSDKFEIVSLAELGCHDDIPETADTLEGNAAIKARYIYDRYGCDCFADDTGLMVDALDGRPGVYSARYAGEHCTPADNVAKLLDEMRDEENRKAHFSTVVALIQDGELSFMEGRVEGTIATRELGDAGFGYDPIFIENASGKSFAQMTSQEKNSVSHRGRALAKLRDFLIMVIMIVTGVLGFSAKASAQEWRLLPSYDGQMENMIVTPDYVYFLGTSQKYDRGSSVTGVLHGVLFRYDIAAEEMTCLNSQSGLTDNNVTAIAYNYKSKYLAVAFESGVVNLLHDNGTCDFIPGLSIADSSLDKSINDITFDTSSNKIFLATNFGYLVIHDGLKEIESSRILNIPVYSCASFGGKIWLGTKDGLYYGGMSAYNFTDFSKLEGPSNVNRIIPLETKLFIYYGSSWNLRYCSVADVATSPRFVDVAPQAVNGVTYSKDYFVATASSGITVFKGNGDKSTLTPPAGYDSSVAATYNGKAFWFTSGREGISCLEAPTGSDGKWTVKHDRFLPNASNAYMCTGMAYHPEYGMLVRNHGYELAFANYMFGAYDVISAYKNGFWSPMSTTYRVKDGLLIDNPWGVAIDPNNTDHVYCGSERSGLFRLDLKNPEKSLQFSKQTDLYGNQNRQGYVAVLPDNPTGTWSEQCVFAPPAFDKNANLWSIYVDPKTGVPDGESPNLIFIVWPPEARAATTSPSTFRKWETIEIKDVIIGNAPVLLPLRQSRVSNVVIGYGNTNSSPVVLLDHSGTFNTQADDKVVKMKNVYDQDGESLTLNRIYTMYEDQTTGLVWVAYNEGIFTFDPVEAFQSPSSVRRIKVPRNDGTNLADYLLNNVVVNSIAADGQGRKWFGTQGAGLVCTSADGKTIYYTYTSSDTALPGDYVYAVQYNPSTNSMMISTDKGLVELMLTSSGGDTSSSDVRCFPNPVRPEYFGVVTIDGLSDDAMVKIVDTNGFVVKECGQAFSGRVEWNLTNNSNKRVPGGVYFVVATGGPTDDNYAKVGKLLVIE